MGGNSSRALNAVTTAITAALGGQTDLQVVTNTLAPYAAQVIGKEFGHGADKNTAAQLVSHAILGATLAYINGGDPTAGGSAAVASEAAANYLTNQLAEKYKDDPKYFVNGEFQANLLSETEKAQIRDLTAGIGAVIGGAVGDSTYNAQLAGVIGQNAVENNGFSIIDENYGKVVKENTKVKFSCPTGYVCPIPEKTLGEKTLLVINDLTIRQLAAAMGAEYDPITKEHFTPKEIQEAKVAMLGLGFSKTLSGPIKLTDEAFENIGKKYGKDIATKIENNFYRDGETSVNWTSAKKASNNINLAGHWEKHKDEFPTLMSQNDYYRFAQNFVTNPPKDTLEKVRKNGDSVLYQPSTNTFAVKTKDGLPRTVFRPDPKDHGYKNNLEYFNAQ